MKWLLCMVVGSRAVESRSVINFLCKKKSHYALFVFINTPYKILHLKIKKEYDIVCFVIIFLQLLYFTIVRW